MKKIRNQVFETNSSSTHCLSHCNKNYDYIAPNSKILIEFVDTDFDGGDYYTLREKVSYLVGHIIHKYKWNAVDYQDLIEDVRNDYDFKELESYIKEKYGKEIVFPENYDGDLEEIVLINHQLQFTNFDEMLEDLINQNIQTKFDIIFREDNYIEIGRD